MFSLYCALVFTSIQLLAEYCETFSVEIAKNSAYWPVIPWRCPPPHRWQRSQWDWPPVPWQQHARKSLRPLSVQSTWWADDRPDRDDSKHSQRLWKIQNVLDCELQFRRDLVCASPAAYLANVSADRSSSLATIESPWPRKSIAKHWQWIICVISVWNAVKLNCVFWSRQQSLKLVVS